jgi:hypothetical protein
MVLGKGDSFRRFAYQKQGLFYNGYEILPNCRDIPTILNLTEGKSRYHPR